MTTYEPGPLAETNVEEAGGGRWTLIFLRDFPHPVAKVWQALTSPDELVEWAPYTADRDLGVTGAAVLTMIDGGNRVDIPIDVTAVDPPRILEYTWDSDLLRWELAPTASGTRLTLRHTMRDRSWLPKVTAGWHICLDVADLLLAGTPVGPIRGEAARAHGWEDLRDAYGAKLGIPPDDAA